MDDDHGSGGHRHPAPAPEKPMLVVYTKGVCQDQHLNRIGDKTEVEDDGPPVVQEQADLVQLAIIGHNIFYTGPAGCGKTFVLHRIKSALREMGKRVDVVAPTGIAAYAVGGTTMHNHLRITPDGLGKRKLEDVLLQYYPGSKRAQDLRATDVLIIDEISMVSGPMLDRFSDILKQARNNSNPFGGLQIIATGDFYQLPPIKPFEFCCELECKVFPDTWNPQFYKCDKCEQVYYDKNKWAFASAAWAESNFLLCALQKMHRQKDPLFLSVLNKIRRGDPLQAGERTYLMRHPSEAEGGIKLMSTNKMVREANRAGLARLSGQEYVYTCYDNFKVTSGHEGKYDDYFERTLDWVDDDDEKKPVKVLSKLKDHRYAARVRFKVGAKVMLLANLAVSRGLCNSTQGEITGFEPLDMGKLPSTLDGTLGAMYGKHKEGHIRNFCQAQKIEGFPIVTFQNGITETIYPECTVQEIGVGIPVVFGGQPGEKRYSLLCRTQLPLTAAWALTIHKAQGMTLERAVVHLQGMQRGQQLYVALSRVKGPRGLRIEGGEWDLEGKVKKCEEVDMFYAKLRQVSYFIPRGKSWGYPGWMNIVQDM